MNKMNKMLKILKNAIVRFIKFDYQIMQSNLTAVKVKGTLPSGCIVYDARSILKSGNAQKHLQAPIQYVYQQNKLNTLNKKS